MSGELPVDGAPGSLQPAVAAAAGGRGLPTAFGARVRPPHSRPPQPRARTRVSARADTRPRSSRRVSRPPAHRPVHTDHY